MVLDILLPIYILSAASFDCVVWIKFFGLRRIASYHMKLYGVLRRLITATSAPRLPNLSSHGAEVQALSACPRCLSYC